MMPDDDRTDEGGRNGEARERVFSGIVASPGLAVGPLIPLDVPAPVSPGAGTAERGSRDAAHARLDRAVTDAVAALETLAASADPMAAEILEIQIALLQDPALAAPAHADIAAGHGAEAAWRAALDAQIADYEAADDAYFRARAADLADMRDRVLGLLKGGPTRRNEAPPGSILVGDDITPSRFLEIDWARQAGAALRRGSSAGHVAMLARARGVPLLVGVALPTVPPSEEPAILDAEEGRLIVAPTRASLRRHEERVTDRERRAAMERGRRAEPATTPDGRRIGVMINVDDPDLLTDVAPEHCDGIGLTRTEFLFRDDDGLPDEETQFHVYARLISWARGRPVTIRTLDAGGDKPVAGLTPTGETNPFLGLRGLRLSLARPEVFEVQLRALARAAAIGPLKVMMPMVTVPRELDEARALFRRVVADLDAEGVAARMPAVGMMVEVPAAALTIADFDADFFSIGSNDLVQYVLAVSRDSSIGASLYDPKHPAVLDLVGRVAAYGAAMGREVSLCGDMAADPACIGALLDAGITILSVAPSAIGRIKTAIADPDGAAS